MGSEFDSPSHSLAGSSHEKRFRLAKNSDSTDLTYQGGQSSLGIEDIVRLQSTIRQRRKTSRGGGGVRCEMKLVERKR